MLLAMGTGLTLFIHYLLKELQMRKHFRATPADAASAAPATDDVDQPLCATQHHDSGRGTAAPSLGKTS